MSRRSVIKTLIEEQLAAANSSNAPVDASAVRTSAGPIRAMGLSLEKMEAETRALQQALTAGAQVIDLDPALIDASFIADRFEDGSEESFLALKTSISENGQEVPILVRPLADSPGRFQVAYGHRRLRVMRELGRPVRAVVRALSDDELVLAQGIENAARQDLSFIEKATFAGSLVERGFARTLVMQALATDKTELSKMLSVVQAIPKDIIHAIGPARKTGRRRWLLLAEHFADPAALARARDIMRDQAFEILPSDTRFARVLDGRGTKAPAPAPDTIRDGTGQVIARVQRSQSAITLAIHLDVAPGFAEFVAGQLDQLLDDFRRRQG